MMNNPFLTEINDREALPRYNLINSEQVAPAIDALIADARSTLARITRDDTPLTWEAVMEPLTNASERLGRAWSAVHHMSGVMDSPEWREAVNSRLAQVTAFYTEVAQDPALFEKTKALAKVIDSQSAGIDPLTFRARKKSLENSLRAFRLGGAELSPENKQKFAALSAQLAQLAQKFSEQLLDSTNATIVHVTDAAPGARHS